jgi:hypothetical protein
MAKNIDEELEKLETKKKQLLARKHRDRVKEQRKLKRLELRLESILGRILLRDDKVTLDHMQRLIDRGANESEKQWIMKHFPQFSQKTQTEEPPPTDHPPQT